MIASHCLLPSNKKGKPRCKNPAVVFFSISFARAEVIRCLMVSCLFCFLCFSSNASVTGSYTNEEPLQNLESITM